MTDYRIGIDVGLNSVGLAAVEVSSAGMPLRILNMESIIHDSGVEEAKTAKTRKAVSGTTRRMRRLIRGRHARLVELDKLLTEFGWPIVDLETVSDPYYPWRVRKELVTSQIYNPTELYEKLSVALRHIARHRGWRNPYTKVQTLLTETTPSKYYLALLESIQKRPGMGLVDSEDTVAEIVCEALKTDLTVRVRGTRNNVEPLLEGKIHQSDNAREIRRTFEVQGLPNDQFTRVANAVFKAKSPKGSAAGRVGKDPLPGMSKHRRAEKASLAFQRYRIVSVIANLRIKDDDSPSGRHLFVQEKRAVLDFLWSEAGQLEGLSWDDVAQILDIERQALAGTAKETELGERAGGRPPINVTAVRIRESKIKPLIAQWNIEDEVGKEALIALLSNGSGSDDSPEAREAEARAAEFLAGLDEELMGKLENIKLPEGRAAYSAPSLRKLTRRMEETDDDLHAARKAVFGVDDKWHPPADPIGLPVGNPAVDRTTKIVARYLAACESMWGAPLSVNIETTREGFVSERMAREDARQRDRNAKENAEARSQIPREFLQASRNALGDEFIEQQGDSGARRSDLYRYRAYSRQGGVCLYCGIELTYGTFEMDHIVPRAGQGSTNTQTNLAAVCRECNHLKGKLPFAIWAKTDAAAERGVCLQEAKSRVDGFFAIGSAKTPRDRQFIKAMKDRLQRTEADDPIDNRSAESVGWMANELRHRIEAHYQEQGIDNSVKVFAGWVTDAARKTSGIARRIELVGGTLVRDIIDPETGEVTRRKNRLDRRHHAVDAATIAMLRPGAAQSLGAQGNTMRDRQNQVDWESFDIAHVLAVRDNMRRQAEIEGEAADINWKGHKGLNPQLFEEWRGQMVELAELIQKKLAADEVPVHEFLRLRLGNSAGHEDTVRKLNRKCVGDAWTPEEIDRAATPAQWVALTRQPDYSKEEGLPENSERRVRVNSTWYGADDELEVFPNSSAYVKIRGGYARIGSPHHLRVYRYHTKMKSGKVQTHFGFLRVYGVDLLRTSKDDLFAVKIEPQTISRRTADDKLRRTLDNGKAEYIGWLVPGDEIELKTPLRNGAAAGLLEIQPDHRRWVVAGSDNNTTLTLRPRVLAGEGISPDTPAEALEALKGKGWRISADILFNKGHPTIIRRDILGRPRLESAAHLPVTWAVSPSTDDGDDET